jgi:hypothetical protein
MRRCPVIDVLEFAGGCSACVIFTNRVAVVFVRVPVIFYHAAVVIGDTGRGTGVVRIVTVPLER